MTGNALDGENFALFSPFFMENNAANFFLFEIDDQIKDYAR